MSTMNPNAKPFIPGASKPLAPKPVVVAPPKPGFRKSDAAAKIVSDEGGKKGHTIKKHLMNSPVSQGKGITQPALEKRTNNPATKTVTAFTKPAGLTKAVKTAMNDPSFKPGTAQQMTVPLTPHKSTGKLPTTLVATKGGATQKMAAKEAVVEFGPGGRLKRAFPVKASLTPQTARTTPKPPVKPAAKTLSQIATKGR
jgi:hypothetical protein